MIGRITLYPVHRGEIFTDTNGKSHALCNGQIIARSSYPSISAQWPTGAYGSTDDDMVMPDLSDNYLRMHAMNTNNNIDLGFDSRATSSGALPTAAQIGTFQSADFSSNHTHASGTQTQSQLRAAVVGAPGNFAPLASVNSQGPDTATIASLNPNQPISVGSASATAFDVAHVKFYPYIALD